MPQWPLQLNVSQRRKKILYKKKKSRLTGNIFFSVALVGDTNWVAFSRGSLPSLSGGGGKNGTGKGGRGLEVICI